MFGFIFSIISFLFQVGFTLSLIGLLVYDARVAWGKSSFQEIWEELGKEKGALSFCVFFLPTVSFFAFFWACEIIKPVAVAVFKITAAAVKVRKAKKNDKADE